MNKQGLEQVGTYNSNSSPKVRNAHTGEDSEELFNHRAAVRNWTWYCP